MTLFFMDRELMALMQDFYTLTGIRIALLDRNYTELLSYPQGRRSFCALMRRDPAFDAKCRASDERACALCRSEKKLQLYRCHAGLTEAAAPIMEEGKVIGYMMFGQVTENGEREDFIAQLRALCAQYRTETDPTPAIRKIKHRTEKQILAAARILDAFTAYILLKEMVGLPAEQRFDGIDRYIEEHLCEEITVETLCSAFRIGRTALYALMRQYTDSGVAAYVKRKRMETARRLIRTTQLSIVQVSTAVGFADYNYFLRVFKREFGVSPKAMRRSANGG